MEAPPRRRPRCPLAMAPRASGQIGCPRSARCPARHRPRVCFVAWAQLKQAVTAHSPERQIARLERRGRRRSCSPPPRRRRRPHDRDRRAASRADRRARTRSDTHGGPICRDERRRASRQAAPERGANTELRCEGGSANKADAARALLTRGADLDLTGPDGKTLFALAAEPGRDNVARVLRRE